MRTSKGFFEGIFLLPATISSHSAIEAFRASRGTLWSFARSSTVSDFFTVPSRYAALKLWRGSWLLPEQKQGGSSGSPSSPFEDLQLRFRTRAAVGELVHEALPGLRVDRHAFTERVVREEAPGTRTLFCRAKPTAPTGTCRA